MQRPTRQNHLLDLGPHFARLCCSHLASGEIKYQERPCKLIQEWVGKTDLFPSLWFFFSPLPTISFSNLLYEQPNCFFTISFLLFCWAGGYCLFANASPVSSKATELNRAAAAPRSCIPHCERWKVQRKAWLMARSWRGGQSQCHKSNHCSQLGGQDNWAGPHSPPAPWESFRETAPLLQKATLQFFHLFVDQVPKKVSRPHFLLHANGFFHCCCNAVR